MNKFIEENLIPIVLFGFLILSFVLPREEPKSTNDAPTHKIVCLECEK